MAFENYTFLKLTLNSEIRPFDCGDSDLNGFLFEDALDAYKDAIPFYKKAGFSFMSSNDENDNTRLMFYDLKNFLQKDK